MANEQNLKPGAHKLTREEASKGGKASGKARREKASLKKALEIILESDIEDKKTGLMLSGAEALATKLFQSAMKGDIRAWEVLRDTAGQKPVNKVQETKHIINMDGYSTNEIRKMLDEEVQED